MDAQADIDHAALGLESHYSPAQQQRIRRLMLEDWQKVGVKLPTYMKLVARYIEDQAIPGGWLAKLSHQTMDKMLKSISTPRYEFWACLHLYLRKKYGDVPISSHAPSDIETLGEALAQFAEVTDTADTYGLFGFAGYPNRALALAPQEGEAFHRAYLVCRYQSDEQFSDEVLIPCHGVGVMKGEHLTAILREVTTRDLESLDIARSALTPLADATLEAQLTALRDNA